MAKVIFVQEECRDRFGTMLLSAVLKKHGHKCEVFIKEKSKDFIGEVLKSNPDIIAFSTMSAGINFFSYYSKKFKELSDAFIIMGGYHPTLFPNIIYEEESLDGICRGEGEYALIELADCLDKGEDYTNIKNLWIKKGDKVYENDLRDLVDINKLPMYDREIYYDKYPELKKSPTKKFFIGRGCPFPCTYCANYRAMKIYAKKGKYVRYSNIDKLIVEMKYVKEKYGATWFAFNGDTVNLNRVWFLEFLKRYKEEIRIPFMCNVRIDLVDEDVVRAMKAAGCDRVDFGIENGDEYIRKIILLRNMDDQEIIYGGRLFKKYNIRVLTSNIIGVPHETVETVMKTVQLNRQVHPEIARGYVFQPYAGTQLYDYAVKNGHLDKDDTPFSIRAHVFQVNTNLSLRFKIPLKLKQKTELVNLVYFFDLLVQHSWIEPFIKFLIKLPPNNLFRLIYAYPMIRLNIKYSKSFKERFILVLLLFKILVKGGS